MITQHAPQPETPNTTCWPRSAQDWTAHRRLLDGNGWLVASVGSFLVRNDSGAALVDLGLGPNHFEVPGMATYEGGRLLASLHAEGLSVEDIDLVLFTHLHRDHVGWTSDGTGGLTFPNARHLVDHAEWDHWQSHTDATGPGRFWRPCAFAAARGSETRSGSKYRLGRQRVRPRPA